MAEPENLSDWSQKRSKVRSESKVGKFVRKSLQNMQHNDVLARLETRIQNCQGLARHSAQGLRMIMETLAFGSQFIPFEEAFHTYSSFFSTLPDEEAFRDKLLDSEVGLNVVIVTHPSTLKRYVVMNSGSNDISKFLDHFTLDYIKGDETKEERKLDRETVTTLLKSMDTEYDRKIVRAVLALLHTRSEIANLGIEATSARRVINEVIEIAHECEKALAAGEEKVNFKYLNQLEKITFDIEEKQHTLEKKKGIWPTKRIEDMEESVIQLQQKKVVLSKLIKKEDKPSANKARQAAKRAANSMLESSRVKRRKLGASRPNEMGEDEEEFLLKSIEEMSTAHGRRHNTVMYMNHRVKARDMLKIVNTRRVEKNKRPLKSLSTVLARGKAKRVTSIQAKRHKGRSLFCCKKPPKTEDNETELTHHQRAHVRNAVYDYCYKEEDRKYAFIRSIDDKAYVRPGTSVGLRDTKKQSIYQPTDESGARKLPKYDWINEQVYVTPSTHRIFTKEPRSVDGQEAFVMSEDDSFVFMRPKAFVGSSGTVWASEDMELRARHPDLYEVEGSHMSLVFRGYCARIKDKVEHFVLATNEKDIFSVTDVPNCVFRQYEKERALHSCEYLEIAAEKCHLSQMSEHEKSLCIRVQPLLAAVINLLKKVTQSTATGPHLWQEYCNLVEACQQLLSLFSTFDLPVVKPRILELTDAGPGVGCNNNEVQLRLVERILIHKLDKAVRVHRARGDSGQNEAERTNAAIGEAMVTGETLNWEHHKQFENMSKEDIEALTLQDYEILEKARMERNAWKVADELSLRVDGEPAPHGFHSCSVTPRDYEQFFFDKEYMSKYASTKAQSSKPGHGYYSMIETFYTEHCTRGELYIEYLKGSCKEYGKDLCTFCSKWSGPQTAAVPRPYPDQDREGLHYVPPSNTPLTTTEGKQREADDYQPRAQIRKLFCNKEITSSNEQQIRDFSRKYVVTESLVREYILHLEHLDLLKRKRERVESEKVNERKEKEYKDYNWKQLYETRQIKGLRVFELEKYISHHRLTTMKLHKPDKVALVETHIAMTLFKEMSASHRQPQESQLEHDEDTDDFPAEETILCVWESDESHCDDESSTDDDSDVFCVCRGHEDGRFIICCDSCDEWYHGECVGIKDTEQAEYTESNMSYICPFCKAT